MNNKCWVCNSKNTFLKRKGLSANLINSSDFRVTDSKYGSTLDIFECKDCSFQFCPTDVNLLKLYEKMDDPEYIETSQERLKQAKELFDKSVHFFKSNFIKTLDIGCGSGLFVKNFMDNGYDAYGLEPSKSLAQFGIKNGLNIIEGNLENMKMDKFDFISLVDVIEHVKNPSEMILKCTKILNNGGLLLIVTPRKDSFFKFILGFKWWHYRLAHVGYFTKKNLLDLCKKNNLNLVHDFSPSWYFPLNYILNRILLYIPLIKNIKINFFKNISIRLNLRDSMALIVTKSENKL